MDLNSRKHAHNTLLDNHPRLYFLKTNQNQLWTSHLVSQIIRAPIEVVGIEKSHELPWLVPGGL